MDNLLAHPLLRGCKTQPCRAAPGNCVSDRVSLVRLCCMQFMYSPGMKAMIVALDTNAHADLWHQLSRFREGA